MNIKKISLIFIASIFIYATDLSASNIQLKLKASDPFGINQRRPNTELNFDQPALPVSLEVNSRLVRVFPRLTFEQNVFLTESGDKSQRLFQVSQSGIIQTFPNIPDPSPDKDLTVYLDISSRVHTHGEQGMLGLAFDPEFGNPESIHGNSFYVYYSARAPLRSVISRFQQNTNGIGADPDSEEILLEVNQPANNHNAGMIAFGPDQHLYIAFGDGGGKNDQFGNGQNPETLLGSILRIDVRNPPDSGLAYAIPSDNPFVHNPPTANARQEIVLWGLRNPYRFSFDQQQGYLFIGDVGQANYEELDVAVFPRDSGGNYGWNIMDGNHPFTQGDTDGLIPPIAEHPHRDLGKGPHSITGGYTYYGHDFPSLYGQHVYADAYSGKIFALQYDGQSASKPTELIDTELFITSFGQNNRGEVYVMEYFGGIYVLRPGEAQPKTKAVGRQIPEKLSDVTALLTVASGQGHLLDGVYPYQVNAPFWSDGAAKERYFVLPDFEHSTPDFAQIDYRNSGGWQFPEHSLLIKNFVLPEDFQAPQQNLRRIETRLLFLHQGQWLGYSYEWNDEQTDAVLLTGSKNRMIPIVNEQGDRTEIDWFYPGRSECQRCHTRVSGFTLGLRSKQINRKQIFPGSGVEDNQLRTFEHIGLFKNGLPDIPSQLPAMVDIHDTQLSLEDRSRSYLDGNCSSCHQPGGPTSSTLDLRWQTPRSEMNAIDQLPSSGDLVAGVKLIDVGDANQSVLLQRISTRDESKQMPPLASNRVDPIGSEMIKQWINALGRQAIAASVNHQPQSFQIDPSPEKPLVFFGPASQNGGQGGVLRMTSASDDTFRLYFQEWLNHDGMHLTEQLAVLTLPVARHILSDGSIWETGQMSLKGNHQWKDVEFSQAFPGKPYIFLSAQTANGPHPTSVRARKVDNAGFQASLEEQESLLQGGHVQESIAWLAVYAPNGSGYLETEAGRLAYSLERISATHRWTPAAKAEIRIQEDTSLDAETWHTPEDVDVLFLGSGVWAQMVSANGLNPSSLRFRKLGIVPVK